MVEDYLKALKRKDLFMDFAKHQTAKKKKFNANYIITIHLNYW